MGDRIKLALAVVVLITALIIPIIGLFIGWYRWDAQTGIVIMVVSAALMFITGALLLFSIRKHNWFTVTLPMLISALYTVFPEIILPFRIDDTIVSALGAVVSYLLLMRKDRNAPRWLALPLVLAVAYAFIGGFIPGPIDDILVEASALAVYAAGVYTQKKDTSANEIVQD